ncbi:MAG: dihydroorotate dehydrogenase (quinone) [Chloroflexi bacterium]|nr:dihydroorotate dehydrogenase (quinone) [Chloroflexota bacterium]MDA1173432.1 dihydroorotate dehydrogenase (quinone) [Chloroflexota bacterium]
MSLRFPILSRLPWYRLLVRPILFRFAPEPAQKIADKALAIQPLWRAYAKAANVPDIPVTVAGLALRNPVGLAAGLDKQCAYLDSLGNLGFGYVIGGTVTHNARPGNPKPRVLRLPQQSSLINALGFPSEGLHAAEARLRKLTDRPANVLVSIAALDEQETLECLTTLEPLVDGIEVNISSPNTAGLRKFQEPVALRGLLDILNAARTKPLFIKIPPYMNEAEHENVMSLVRACRDAGMTGITVMNTIPVEDARLAMGRGGLSGLAVREDMLRIVPEVRAEVGSEMVINACGGIATAEDARRALAVGANTVQIYTSMVYRGPGVVGEIVKGLAKRS